MSNVTSIVVDGKNVNINQELFSGYLKESFEHLSTIESATDAFKEIVETVSETTGLKKPVISKFFKQRFEASTAKTKELGQLFEKLDEVLG